jgi:hypothetical protein
MHRPQLSLVLGIVLLGCLQGRYRFQRSRARARALEAVTEKREMPSAGTTILSSLIISNGRDRSRSIAISTALCLARSRNAQ